MNESAVNSALSVEEAINRALEAEAKARQEVERCEARAAAALTEARARARRIEARRDARMAALRVVCNRATQDILTNLAAEEQALPRDARPSEAQLTSLKEAVESLAARLTGGALDTTPAHEPQTDRSSVSPNSSSAT